MNSKQLLCGFALCTAVLGAQAQAPADPYLWLEDVTGERALAWVRERNADTAKRLAATPGFDALRTRLQALLDLEVQPLPEREEGRARAAGLLHHERARRPCAPGHARKMAARMIEPGHRVLYWENLEGGHAGAADSAQRARESALEYAFLWQALGVAPATP